MSVESQEHNFKFACPHCGQHLEAEPDWVGMVVECPTCSKALTVPQPPSATSAAPGAPIASSKPQPEIQTFFSREEGALPPPPIISVVKKGEGLSRRKRTWLIPVAIGATVLLIVGLLVVRPKSKEEHARKTIPLPPSSSSYPTKTLTQRERKAIGKIIYTLTNVEANKTKFAKELNATAEGGVPEILTCFMGRAMADHIEDEEEWKECPYEFQKAIKRFYVAMGDSEISAVVAKYGRSTVVDTLKQYKIHANFTKYIFKVMDENAASIENEFKEAQVQMRVCLSKYGISANEMMNFAIEEFVETRMSASGLCKELASSKNYFKLVNDHTVMWDPGGENPPMICIVTFADDGTASMMQDNTFFARENPRIPIEMLARKMEAAFPQANKYDYRALQEVRGVIARVENGRLFFGGDITVEPGKVEEKVTLLFMALNTTRTYLRLN